MSRLDLSRAREGTLRYRQRTAAPLPAGRARCRAARLGGRGHRRGARGRCGGVRRPGGAEGHARPRPGEDAGREGAVRRVLRTLLQARRIRRAGRDGTAAARADVGARSDGRRRRRGRPGRRRDARADAAGRRSRRAGRRDGAGGTRGGAGEHPVLHAEEPLCAAHPGPHGIARAGTRDRGAAAERRRRGDRARRTAGGTDRGVARRGARFRRTPPAAVRARRDGAVSRGTAEERSAVQPGAARPGPDARAGARDGEEAGGALCQDAAAAVARAVGCAAHDAAEHGLGRHSVHHRVEAEAHREASGDGAVRRVRLGRADGAVPADVPVCGA